VNRIRIVSGRDEKGPACILVETGARRLLLDLGYGPDPGRQPDLAGIGAVDALLLSHGHRDHAGSLAMKGEVGDPPIWCTPAVASMLPPGTPACALPLTGECEVAGVRIRTGRNGHAPGGVWLHLELEGGNLLYTGDCSVESPVHAFDPPPPATVAVVDASYGDYDTPLDAAASALADLLAASARDGAAPDAVLPVPPGGRGPEIAWHLATRCGWAVQLGDDLRAAIERLCSEAADSLRPGMREPLLALAGTAPGLSDAPGIRLAGSADGSTGDSAALLDRFVDSTSSAIVFTGHLPPGSEAQALITSGRARYLRWNVHPRRRDIVALARECGVRHLLPVFGAHARMTRLKDELGTAALLLAPTFSW
jgi:glyoxylase-like metal-dependent hydrolase (beta-lactamase superfamily II)